MTIAEYQKKAEETFKVKNLQKEYVELGLRGEVGEVCDKIKKLIRDDGWEPGKEIAEEKKEAIIMELGDVMWYAVIYSKVNNVMMGFTIKHNTNELNNIGTYSTDNLITLAIGLSNEVAGRVLALSVMVYVATMAKILGYTLEDVCQRNYLKLQDRMKRGKISGSGDNR